MQINGVAGEGKRSDGPAGRHLQDSCDQGCLREGRPDVDFRYVAQAIDDAKGAELDKVGIMTPKVEAGQ